MWVQLLSFASLLWAPGARASAGRVPAEAPGVPEDMAVEQLLSDPESLVRLLRERNADVRAAAFRVSQGEADVKASRLPPNPALAVSLGDVPVGTSNPPGLTFSQTAIYSLTLSQTVELGKRGPRYEAAALRLRAGQEDYVRTLSETLADARHTLGRVAYLKARQQALEESLSSVRQMQELQRTRLAHGDLSGNDFDRLQLDTQLLEADVAQNSAEYQAALAACSAVLFSPCVDDRAGPDVLDGAAPLPEAADAGAAVDAVEDRPDLKSLEMSAASALQEAVLALRRRIPDPSLSVGYTRDLLTISGDQPRSLTFGVSLPLPAFDRGQHDAARATAHAGELRASASATRQRAQAEVAGLQQRRRALESVLVTLRGEALARSKAVLDSTLSAVNQGELSMTDLLLARRTHTDLVLKIMDLTFGAFEARNDLRRATGADAALVRRMGGDPWTTR
jgi:cobalt-zinc-cadmium efflux system outer membrane protein